MIRLTCLVDNCVRHGSSLRGEHGFSFYIETPSGDVLFDAGQSGEVLLHNAKKMDIDLAGVASLALSHAHYDHTGGLIHFFKLIRRKIPLFANPDLLRPRYSVREDQAIEIGLRIPAYIFSQKADLRLNAEPSQILPGVFTSGEVKERNQSEGRSPHHFIYSDGNWIPDPYKDDLSLVIETSSGLILLCGCCHAGLLNALAHVQREFHQDIRAVIGGTHLASCSQETLAHTIEILGGQGQKQVPFFYLNHCSGERALVALAQAFGERAQTCPAGTVLSFN